MRCAAREEHTGLGTQDMPRAGRDARVFERRTRHRERGVAGLANCMYVRAERHGGESPAQVEIREDISSSYSEQISD